MPGKENGSEISPSEPFFSSLHSIQPQVCQQKGGDEKHEAHILPLHVCNVTQQT